VGVQLPKVPEFVVCLYGVLQAGGLLIPMNTLNRGPEIEYLLQFAGADFLISHASCADEAAKGLAAPAASFVATEPGDTAVLLCTSGTTGKAQGRPADPLPAVHERRGPPQRFRMDRDSVVVAVMPLFHALGLSGILNATILAGGTVRPLPKFDPTRVLEVVDGDRATILHGVPTMYHALLHHPERTSYDLSSLTACGSAGAAIAADPRPQHHGRLPEQGGRDRRGVRRRLAAQWRPRLRGRGRARMSSTSTRP
jgi:long-chain acyl-CoA synthetase